MARNNRNQQPVEKRIDEETRIAAGWKRFTGFVNTPLGTGLLVAVASLWVGSKYQAMQADHDTVIAMRGLPEDFKDFKNKSEQSSQDLLNRFHEVNTKLAVLESLPSQAESITKLVDETREVVGKSNQEANAARDRLTASAKSIEALEDRLKTSEEKLNQLESIAEGVKSANAAIAKVNGSPAVVRIESGQLRLPLGKGTTEDDGPVSRTRFVFRVDELPMLADRARVANASIPSIQIEHSRPDAVRRISAAASIDPVESALHVFVWHAAEDKLGSDFTGHGYTAVLVVSWPLAP